jgi:hypothetical protein
MAYTQAQIDELEALRASGALVIDFQGKRVRFRDLAELDTIIAQAKRDVAGTTKPSPVRRYRDARSGW